MKVSINNKMYSATPNTDGNGKKFIRLRLEQEGYYAEDKNKWSIYADVPVVDDGYGGHLITGALIESTKPFIDSIEEDGIKWSVFNINKWMKSALKNRMILTKQKHPRFANKSGWGYINGRSKNGYDVAVVEYDMPVSTRL